MAWIADLAAHKSAHHHSVRPVHLFPTAPSPARIAPILATRPSQSLSGSLTHPPATSPAVLARLQSPALPARRIRPRSHLPAPVPPSSGTSHPDSARGN